MTSRPDPYEQYARIAPFVIVGAVVIGYLLGGGLWWGAPIIAAIALVYAAIRVKIGRRLKGWLDKRLGTR